MKIIIQKEGKTGDQYLIKDLIMVDSETIAILIPDKPECKNSVFKD